MAYLEMVLMMIVALTSLVLLALAVASGPPHHHHAAHRHGGRTRSPESPDRTAGAVTVRSRTAPDARTATRRRTSTRHHSAARCSRPGTDWSRLMGAPDHLPTTFDAER